MKNRLFALVLLVLFFGIHYSSFAQLPVPTNLTATQITWMNHTAVKLVWQGSANMERYNVYKKHGGINDPGDFIRIASHIMRRDFMDPMVLQDSTYSYYVTSTGPNGESDPSNTVEITIDGLQTFATITGTLVDETSNDPIEGGKVRISAAGSCFGFTAHTDQNGNFTAHLLPGDYYLRSMAWGYIPEFYDNAATIQQATMITLNNSDSLDFDIALTPYTPPVLFELSGTVSDGSGNPVLSRIMVTPVRMNSYFNQHLRRGTITDSSGNYTIPVREGDTVIVFCKPFGFDYLPEYFDDKHTYAEADRIVITGDVTDVDFILDEAPVFSNGINGLVANEDNEGVVAHVTAFNLQGNHMMKYRTVTDSMGLYVFNNVIPAEYILLAMPHDEYLPTFFRYDGQQTLSWRDADSVVVEETGIIPDINFTVRPFNFEGFAKVFGTVSDDIGNRIKGAIIFAVDENDGIAAYSISDAQGGFTLEGFEPGNYRIFTDKFGFSGDEAVNVTLDYSGNQSQGLAITLIPDGVTSVEDNNLISGYRLDQNYPNPFNPSTVVSYQLSDAGNVTLKIYDVLGREVTTLVNEYKSAGRYEVKIDAEDWTSGIYFYQIKSGQFIETRKMILMK